ncbi:DEAD/DEAH box helicase, partial [Bacteriovoracaceae bacterium]|nr:DEAD/DEAH box helicase [Bacteriovoracaceae bacterium]
MHNRESINEFFDDIDENINDLRKAFLTTKEEFEEEDLRSVEEIKQILSCIRSIAADTYEFLSEHSHLKEIIEKNYGPITQLSDREYVVETALDDDFIFPEKEDLHFIVDDKINDELLSNFPILFKEFLSGISQNHETSITFVRDDENFNLNARPNALACPCVICMGEYRSRIRELAVKETKEFIDNQESILEEQILEMDNYEASKFVYKVRRKLENNVGHLKYKLKRASLNKLESEYKGLFREKFGPDTDIGKTYREKLRISYNNYLLERELRPEIIEEEEFHRFFHQLGIGIWKMPKILKRDFEKFTNSILTLKRKDISAKILTEYLGQFWVHSKARLKKRKIIYHMGPTNSGKTYHAIEELVSASNGCYLAPLRLLASELYDTMNAKGAITTLLTGEEVIEKEDSTHFSSTIEMAKLNDEFECAVIDEIQMIRDPQRGWAWTRALINLNADTVHICGDPSVEELIRKIVKLTGDEIEIKNYTRMCKLDVEPSEITLANLKKNDALIVFSRRNALKYKADLEKLDFKVSIVYGRLGPEVRREQARKFDEGETDVIVSTDAIAMGMNLPVKRIVFSALSKFINSKEHMLSDSEVKQISGRAGRFGRFPTGTVTTLRRVEGGIERLHEALEAELVQREVAMVGPDLEIFRSVNKALEENSLPTLSLSEFLRLFNTMKFDPPFYCVDLKEMIELAEMVENADGDRNLSDSEVFGFACAPVNQGLVEHVQYYVWILNHYSSRKEIKNEAIDDKSDDIDYLETSIKCVELYQWLARHFDNYCFDFDPDELLHNKSNAIDKLNGLLSERVAKKCHSCG